MPLVPAMNRWAIVSRPLTRTGTGIPFLYKTVGVELDGGNGPNGVLILWLLLPATDPLQLFEGAFMLLKLLTGLSEFSLRG